jgi:hypothetical protein
MAESIKLKEKYVLARCCAPTPGVKIRGYCSYADSIKVHRHDCPNLNKSSPDRLVALEWEEILAEEEFSPSEDYQELEKTDFIILTHHREYGVDYSLKVAAMLRLPKQEVFDRHKKLRAMGLLERVEPLMIRYRKGIVDNKWIKHRNHTYYRLTSTGEDYLDYFVRHAGDEE